MDKVCFDYYDKGEWKDMPDYSLCYQIKCKKAEFCSRFLGKCDTYQTMMCPDEKECGYFWDVINRPPFELLEYEVAYVDRKNIYENIDNL